MAFRNDHDAALDRAASLAKDLEAERKKTAALERQLAAERVEGRALEAERAERRRLEAKLEASKRKPEPGLLELRSPRIPLWRDPDDASRSDVVGVILALVVFFALGLFALALGYA